MFKCWGCGGVKCCYVCPDCEYYFCRKCSRASEGFCVVCSPPLLMTISDFKKFHGGD